MRKSETFKRIKIWIRKDAFHKFKILNVWNILFQSLFTWYLGVGVAKIFHSLRVPCQNTGSIFPSITIPEVFLFWFIFTLLWYRNCFDSLRVPGLFLSLNVPGLYLIFMTPLDNLDYFSFIKVTRILLTLLWYRENF